MRIHARATLLGLSVFALFAAGDAGAAGRSGKRLAQGSEVPAFEAELQVVNVEVPVQVVDRDGRPVRDLEARLFKVWDDGKPRPIVSVDVVDFETLERGASGVWPTRLPLTSRRHFLLLFDLSFSTPASVMRSRLAAREFVLHSLHPTDLAAVATFSIEYGPRILMSFTPDRAQLARALDTLSLQESPSRHTTLDPLAFMLAPQTSGVSDFASSRQGNSGDLRQSLDAVQLETMKQIAIYAEKTQKEYERGRISTMTRGLGDLARTLDVVRGRKQIVLFSEGFDSRLLLGRDPDPLGDQADETDYANRGMLWMVDNDNRFGNTGLQSDVERMLEEFRRADCVIQAVDVGGLRAGGEAQGTGRTPGSDTLFVFAHETGGNLFKDDNNLGDQLQRVLRRSGLSYVLTIEASEVKPDGKYHRLRVELDGVPGATLSYRRGYYAPRPFGDLPALEKRLLAADAIATAVPRRDIDVRLLAAPFRSGGEASYLPVIVEIDGPELLQGQTGERIPVELYAYVTDERGGMRDYFARTLTIEKSAATLLGHGGLKYYGHFELPAGSYLVRVLARNGETGRTGVATLPVSVPSFDQAGAVLLPPFAFEEPGRWLMLREVPPSGSNSASVVYPFTVNGEPYVPAVRPTAHAGDKLRLCLVGYNMPAGKLEITARVVDAEGHEVAGGTLARAERTVTGIAGVDKWIADFDPSGLAQGGYDLRLAVVDPTKKVVGSATTAFDVIE